MKGPDPKSKRTAQRKNRGFRSLELSCRKHRRAKRRSEAKRTINRSLHEAGAKVERDHDGGKLQSFIMTAGGSIKYH